jgi:hypothetical protein
MPDNVRVASETFGYDLVVYGANDIYAFLIQTPQRVSQKTIGACLHGVFDLYPKPKPRARPFFRVCGRLPRGFCVR